jgi:hypothetical protein
MRYRHTVLILAGCLLATGAWAANPSRSGYFDSVSVSPRTGDEGGIRIQVNDGPSPTVDFALCEGACLDLVRFPAKIEGDRISFVYVEDGFDRDGKKVSETRARVDGRFVSRGLLLKMDFLAYSDDDKDAYALIPRRKRQP